MLTYLGASWAIYVRLNTSLNTGQRNEQQNTGWLAEGVDDLLVGYSCWMAERLQRCVVEKTVELGVPVPYSKHSDDDIG